MVNPPINKNAPLSTLKTPPTVEAPRLAVNVFKSKEPARTIILPIAVVED